jgi:hypothetical protein
LFDSATMAPGAGSRLRTVTTTRLPTQRSGSEPRPRRHTTVKNNASPSPATRDAHPETSPVIPPSVWRTSGVDEMPAKRMAEDRLKSPESVSAQSVVAVTRSDLLTIC